ncbi:nitroreductase/quinone reductase family protein [Mycobacterium sp.]|uniref:nitroreductase/quinone reductase family protein n=1 Tax=Mycobacterium sp. TaxID=1785 RepID=UPI003F97B11A
MAPTPQSPSAKSPPQRVKDTVRVFNKYVLTPTMLRLAGRKYWYASVIRHTGRHSGKNYATPVVADRVTDGFIVPLPYGKRVDWLRNVLAAKRATIQANGRTFDVVEPEILDAAAALPQITPRRRSVWQRLGITDYVKLKFAPTGDTQR